MGLQCPIRVLHLVSHPIQYFAPLYRALSQRPEIDLSVVFCSDASIRDSVDPGFGTRVTWNTDLLGGFKSDFPASALGRSTPTRFLEVPQLDILKIVAKRDYDVLWLHGYAHLTRWLAWAIARIRHKPVLLREEQTLLHGRSWAKRFIKRVALRPLLKTTFGLYIGEESRRYFEHHGGRAERLFATPYCVDNDSFRSKAEELARNRSGVRAQFGISDNEPAFLFCGKLIPKKAPDLLLEAFRAIRARRKCWLLLVGDGALREELEDYVKSNHVDDVVFAGFVDQQEIAKAYAAADVLVLPSAHDETWGLVVNEAFNFGLPAVVSEKVGCATDLVRDGWNGYVVPVRNRDALIVALDRLVGDPEVRRAFGKRSRELVSRYDVKACADGIIEAARAATARRGDGYRAIRTLAS